MSSDENGFFGVYLEKLYRYLWDDLVDKCSQLSTIIGILLRSFSKYTVELLFQLLTHFKTFPTLSLTSTIHCLCQCTTMSSDAHKGNTYTVTVYLLRAFGVLLFLPFSVGFLSLAIRAQSVALVLYDKTYILCTFLRALGFPVLHMDYVISDLEPRVSTMAIVSGVWPPSSLSEPSITLHNPVIESCYVVIIWRSYSIETITHTFTMTYYQVYCFFMAKINSK